MQRKTHTIDRGRSAPGTPTPARRRAAILAALAFAVLLFAIIPAPVAAADDSATFRLTGIHENWPTGAPGTNAPTRIDRVTHDANGGSIEFTARSQDTSADCVGKEQHFKFSWKFSQDVSTVSGKQGDNLFIINTKWEGDTGTRCVDENPWVWIKSGGTWGTGPGEGVSDQTFKLAFVNPMGENRVSFDGKGSSSPTVSFNAIYPNTAGFEITTGIRWLGGNLDIVYAYDKVPGAPTVTATTVPQTTVATTTTATTVSTMATTVPTTGTTTVMTPITTRPTTQALTTSMTTQSTSSPLPIDLALGALAGAGLIAFSRRRRD
jgi:MYXO-CTERM domain-containing protein